MTLQLHRAPRTDLLADQLGDLLANPLPDPFAQEVVITPARGMERWLTQRLSHRLGVGERGGDGVCAGVRFLSPRSLVAMLLGTEREDPWDPDRLVWPLLAVIDENLDEPWCATLATHLGHGRGGDAEAMRKSRRYSVARRLAGLFASYAVQRPTIVRDWREGRATDGAGGELDADLAWQPELWRRLLARMDAPAPDVRHQLTLKRLRGGGDLELPDRLSLFGHTRLPVTEVELLRALGEVRDVHLWLPQTSSALWDALAPTAQQGPVRRREDPSALSTTHPLLSSLGRDARELRRTLGPVPDVTAPAQVATPSTLLGWLQQDLRADSVPGATVRTRRVVAADDDSVQVHACHGAARQVDVLREVLVGLLADDPTLEPRDILVMCPDIEAYAPLFQAGFGLGDVVSGSEAHPAHTLRVRLADRALTSTNPLLAIAARLVGLAGGRVQATDVLDLAATEPVRRRFGLDSDDVDQLTTWVEHAVIRWGLDDEGRGAFRMSGLGGQNTWRAGLDRLLLGVTMAEGAGRWLGPVLPLDDVGSGRVDLAGRFAELVDRLAGTLGALEQAGPADEWVRALEDGVAALTDTRPADAWQVAQFHRGLVELRAAAGVAGGATRLRLADVRVLLEHQLGGRPTRANFRSGTLTVCTMVPMRSVPHRVICLVGLDDGTFPRSGTFDGDDALARDPMTGERDARSEDRQLLLDAIMAATEKLVITYTGANEHTGAQRPPAVPLGEVLDALAITASHPAGDGTHGADLVLRHPLQPFDARNFSPGALGGASPFSFDRAALAGARAQAGDRVPVPPLLPEALPPREPDDVNLADLQRFLSDPVGYFLRTVLDVSVPREADEVPNALPIELDGLEKWQVGDRMLRDVLDGLDLATSQKAERRRGQLPPLALGGRTLQEVAGTVQGLVDASTRWREGPSRTVDVDIDIGGGRRLSGSVAGVHGTRAVTVTYSRLKAKQRLQAWVDLLALTAADPGTPWTAHLMGRAGSGPEAVTLGPVEGGAVDRLRALVDIFDRGRREPLPVPVESAAEYARVCRADPAGRTVAARMRAAAAWETAWDSPVPGENAKAPHVRVFGPAAGIDVLLGEPAPDERWNASPTRLGQYAVRVWDPLLAHESWGLR